MHGGHPTKHVEEPRASARGGSTPKGIIPCIRGFVFMVHGPLFTFFQSVHQGPTIHIENFSCDKRHFISKPGSESTVYEPVLQPKDRFIPPSYFFPISLKIFFFTSAIFNTSYAFSPTFLKAGISTLSTTIIPLFVVRSALTSFSSFSRMSLEVSIPAFSHSSTRIFWYSGGKVLNHFALIA